MPKKRTILVLFAMAIFLATDFAVIANIAVVALTLANISPC
jgi:hypothetical protein